MEIKSVLTGAMHITLWIGLRVRDHISRLDAHGNENTRPHSETSTQQSPVCAFSRRHKLARITKENWFTMQWRKWGFSNSPAWYLSASFRVFASLWTVIQASTLHFPPSLTIPRNSSVDLTFSLLSSTKPSLMKQLPDFADVSEVSYVSRKRPFNENDLHFVREKEAIL